MAATIQHPMSVTTIFLDQPPSCLEFCPEAPDHFVVGTYLLSETKDEDGEIQQTKTGSVQVWNLDPATNELYARIQSPNAYHQFQSLTISQILGGEVGTPIRSL